VQFRWTQVPRDSANETHSNEDGLTGVGGRQGTLQVVRENLFFFGDGGVQGLYTNTLRS